MAEFYTIATFAVDKRQDLTMTEVYQEIGNVSLPAAALGTYEYGFTLTEHFTEDNKSEFIQFSTDGGTVWTEFSTEPSDKSDDKPFGYFFFKEGLSGDLNLIVQARKQDGTGVMTVEFVDTYMRRVQ